MGRISAFVNDRVQESKLPTEKELGYKSTVGVYGGKINYDEAGSLIFDMRGVISKIDHIGDRILRNGDEHVVQNLRALFKKRGFEALKFLFPGAKRYRGTPEEIAENIKRLGLENEYALHDWGIAIKNSDIYTKSYPLQDIYRSDSIENEELSQVDRFEALNSAAHYIREIHGTRGAIGEVLPSDIIFQKKEEGNVSNPILNIPDIVYNPQKSTSDIDKKTTDLLDFVVSIGFEEFRRSQDENQVKAAITTIIQSYNDEEIIRMLKSFVKRGRLTMQGKALITMHNKARLNFDKNRVEDVRRIIVSVCDEYLHSFSPTEA